MFSFHYYVHEIKQFDWSIASVIIKTPLLHPKYGMCIANYIVTYFMVQWEMAESEPLQDVQKTVNILNKSVNKSVNIDSASLQKYIMNE